MLLTVEEVCNRALRIIGRGDKPSADDTNRVIDTLTILLKAWSNRGIHLFDLQDQYAALEGYAVSNDGTQYICKMPHTAASTNEPGTGADWENYWVEAPNTFSNYLTWASGAEYLPPNLFILGSSDLFSVTYPWLHDDGSQTPLTRISKDDFQALQKGDIGTPEYIYVEKSTNSLSVRVWPIPDKDTYEMSYTGIVSGTSVTSGSEYAAVPDNWLLALQYGLAAELAHEYSLPDTQTLPLVRKAEIELRRAMGTEFGEADTCHVSPCY